jgi:hypothetical protein
VIRGLAAVSVAAAVLAPASLQTAARQALPNGSFVRLCRQGTHGYALVSTGAFAVFERSDGWRRVRADTSGARSFCERRRSSSGARMCRWQFNSSNVAGTWSRAQNLSISAADRLRLRTAYFACHVHNDEGPAAGSVFFSRYGGYEWAVGSFAAGGDQPETFVRPAGQTKWSDEGDTGGELCESRIPLPVLKLWGWTRPSTVGARPGFRCFFPRR